MSLAGLHLTRIGQGRFLMEPNEGLDVSQRDEVLIAILTRLQEGQASLVYYDLGNVPLVDEVYYGWLAMLARACSAINVRMICVQMQPTAAFALSSMLQGPPPFETALSVET
ncbi:MAG: hypothetical protein HXY26_05470 [Hydrogenophilaceae bacterium]|nr:hypothetical protein [Hydrogenophilaceae bacterium]